MSAPHTKSGRASKDFVSEGLVLSSAFTRIGDPNVRRTVVELVEEIARQRE